MAGQSDGWITTARVLRRAGFGTTGAQVDAVAGQNWSKYVDAALAADPDADPFQKRASDFPGKGEPVWEPSTSTIVAGKSRRLAVSVTTRADGPPVGGLEDQLGVGVAADPVGAVVEAGMMKGTE